MSRFHISKLHLVVAWGSLTVVYLALHFELVTILELADARNANKWNEVGKDITLTLSTSLLFWLVTESLITLWKKREYRAIQSALIDTLVNDFNNSFTYMEHESLDSNVPRTRHLVQSTDQQLVDLLNKYGARIAAALGNTPDTETQTSSILLSSIRVFRETLKRQQALIAPYLPLVPPEFYKHLQEMTTGFDDLLRTADLRPEHRMEMHLTALFHYRRDLIELSNLFRKDHGVGQLVVPSLSPTQ